MKKIELARMTWKEAEQAVERHPIIYIPIGSVEQNGPQSPLGTDFIKAEYFAKRVAEQTGGVVIPAIPFGNSRAFQNFTGTIWLRPETLYAVVREVCECLVKQGFDHFIIVNNHGPNEPPIEEAVRDIQSKYKVCMALVWPAQLMSLMLDGLYDNTKQVKGHGGEPSTSVLLALCPDDVRMDLASKDKLNDYQGCQIENSANARFKGMPVSLYLNMEQVSETGITGDPSVASAERGEIILERLVNWGVEFARHFETMQPYREGEFSDS